MAAPNRDAGRSRWTTSWAAAQTAPTATDTVASSGLTDGTFTAAVRLSAGGQVRLRYGHAFGTAPVLVGPVTAGGQAVTFGGKPQAWIAAGASLTSDPVAGLRTTEAARLTVETRLPGPTGPLSFHRNTHASHSVDGVRTTSVFLLTGVEVTGAHGPVIAVLGDSIAEGVGTPDDADLRWPDQLARRLPGSAVANLGISGNRVLLDDARFGPSGQARFDRDVLSLPGLRTVFVHLGINDLQQPPGQTDPALVLAGYRQLVLRGRGSGLRVVGATVTPFEGWARWTPGLEAVRQRINAAVRTGRVFDAVADFDVAVRDPDRPSRMLAAYDSADGLHPNPSGHAALAAAVDRRHLL
ncbi:SGNH/GDSL hydrolase family protein [Streptomyces sp. NBC_01527]|uniref:SGNH/GDSL hydrolase family protein n=1 Tax=unclassified Streptomyces TaxID=2593676 RepID=UPI002E1485B0|nr:SGNH/GDSL hydrolase family protein [Streptomyces sp. NBC_01230]